MSIPPRMDAPADRQDPAPCDIDALLRQALELHRQGAFDATEALYRRILEADPRNSIALHGLGVLRNLRGDFGAAIDLLGEALRLNPRSAQTHLHQGIALWNLDRRGEALVRFQHCLMIDPGNVDALLNRAVALRELRRPQEALASLDKLLTLVPDSPVGNLNRGIVLQDLNRFEESLVSLDHAIALDPELGAAQQARGEALVRLGRPAEAVGCFASALPRVAEPHLLNRKLNDLECELGLDTLASFPPQVFLNFNQQCNARCLFCHMPEPRPGLKDAVEPRDLERMTWLRYVSDLALVGGFGETLVNPFFKENLAFLRASHPHLRLCLWTNGISITEELCNLLVEGLSSLVVSLNAATAATWEQVMGGGRGFERICDRLRAIRAIKASHGTLEPRVSLSMVLLKETVHELPAMVDLAKELGAEELLVQHYSTHEPANGRTQAAATSSLYLDRDRCDHFLETAAARARTLGIRTSFPPPFAANAQSIEAGSRTEHAPATCTAPWKALLLFDELEPGLRQASVCCTGPFFLAAYRKEELSEAGLRHLWNHPSLKFLRRTVHEQGRNPVCDWCQSTDRFDPADTRWDPVRRAAEPVFKRLDAAYRSNGTAETENMEAAMFELATRLSASADALQPFQSN